jgi:hypothetical protein
MRDVRSRVARFLERPDKSSIRCPYKHCISNHAHLALFAVVVLCIDSLATSHESTISNIVPHIRSTGETQIKNLRLGIRDFPSILRRRSNVNAEGCFWRSVNLRGGGSPWTPYVDPASGATYYYNAETQETSWVLPAAAETAETQAASTQPQTAAAASTASPDNESVHSQQATATHAAHNTASAADPTFISPVSPVPAAAAPAAVAPAHATGGAAAAAARPASQPPHVPEVRDRAPA